jgi:hypothetical protein
MRCFTKCSLRIAFSAMLTACNNGDGYGCYSIAQNWGEIRHFKFLDKDGKLDGFSRSEFVEQACQKGISAAC